MASFNRVILLGNLTRDVELKSTKGGTSVTSIGLAVNERRKDASGKWTEEPVFVDITLWGRTAEIASEYLSKGSPVLIEGRLKTESWERDGRKQSKLSVVGDSLQLLGNKGGQQAPGNRPQRDGRQPTQAQQAQSRRQPVATDEDDIPF